MSQLPSSEVRTGERDDTRAGAIPSDPAAQWPHLQQIGTRPRLGQYLRDVWARREFAVTIALGELRSQHQDTVLGAVWHLLNPLLLAGVYYLVFGLGLRASDRVPNYLGFLIVGVLTFNYTRTALRSGARMILKNRKLVQTVNFPRAVLPLGSMVEETLAHLPALAIMWALLVTTGELPQLTWLLVVPIVVVHAMFNLGLSMLTARMTFHFRDVQEIIPFLTRLWFYASGVLYPINDDIIPWDWLRTLLRANPIFAIIDVSRGAFMDGSIRAGSMLVALAWALALLVFGFWYFRRGESEYGRV